MGLSSQNKIKVEGGMASMTDLVFLLLIFFIILSTMVSSGHKVDLPSGKGSTTEKATTKVEITQDNQFSVNSMIVSPQNLAQAITNAIDPEDKTVELYCDKHADFESAAMVIDVVKQNQWKIVIKTKSN
ncbi:MAG: biopolymer transporter ExbD [Bacteroidia bacterium]